jgi:hypothetical protein
MDIVKKSSKLKIRWLIILAVLIVVLKIFSNNSPLIERLYSNLIYPEFAASLRIILGWLPFSFGDIIYMLLILWFIWNVWRLSKKLLKRQLNKKWFARTGYKILITAMVVYIIFNSFWGLNYNRLGIEIQLNLQVKKIDSVDLKMIETLLVQKVNQSKKAIINQSNKYPSNRELFIRAAACYLQVKGKYPFLKYDHTSLKSSMFGWWGNYFGFTGYYNPFTGEAQVNTSVPKFILPYTTTHEIAHQLGYAKEEEANFVGYLAATSSTDTLFHYSTYLDLFVYANRKLFYIDSVSAKAAVEKLLPGVKADLTEWKEFARKHQSPLEPFVKWTYGNFLKANQQPKGIISYDEVIADLIAFYKKYGRI